MTYCVCSFTTDRIIKTKEYLDTEKRGNETDGQNRGEKKSEEQEK